MIFIGLDNKQKIDEINRYVAKHGIERVYVISADEFPLPYPDSDQVKYSDVIMYVTFYRLLQEITQSSLIVLNECLRTQNRYDLSYNCIRNYLNMTAHQLIFQQFPIIDQPDDFMILFDFDTRSRWKRRKFDVDLIAGEARVCVQTMPVHFERVNVPTSCKTQDKYIQERDRMFETIGNRDPHVIPRNLYLLSGPDKQAYIDANNLPLFGSVGSGGLYVARNKRLNRSNVVTYDEVTAGQYTIVDLPHRFIDFSDFIRKSGQTESRVLVSDLRVDYWYFDRYTEWAGRIHDTLTSLQQ